jgi:hypothetical protein
MTEQNEAHFEIHSSNKAKDRMTKKKTSRRRTKKLLVRFKSDDLIDMLMKLDQEQD